MRLIAHFFACVIVLMAATGCSSQQWYSAGQNWQRSECNKIVDAEDRKRCAAQAETSYDTYQRQAEEAKTSK